MREIDLTHKKIVISRTDSIGDVILTLPMCAWLKQKYPTVEIIFFGKTYTEEIVRCCPFIDKIICWDQWSKHSFAKQKELLTELNVYAFVHVFPNKELAKLVKSVKIPYRIGTSHRMFHLTTCNIRPDFTRKRSNAHEAQLNFKLLRNFGVDSLPSIDELIDSMKVFRPQSSLSPFLKKVLETSRKKVILHTKSQGSAVEWPLEKYIKLTLKLIDSGYRVYFSGTEQEGEKFRSSLPKDENCIDLSGKSSLGELIAFISCCDALVACSTGPLHLAAVLGIRTVGLYTNLRPMHPGRWAPLGNKVVVLTNENNHPSLNDISKIEMQEVFQAIEN